MVYPALDLVVQYLIKDQQVNALATQIAKYYLIDQSRSLEYFV